MSMHKKKKNSDKKDIYNFASMFSTRIIRIFRRKFFRCTKFQFFNEGFFITPSRYIYIINKEKGYSWAEYNTFLCF